MRKTGKKHDENYPKPKLLQLFCRHRYDLFVRSVPYLNLSGETLYGVCTRCGRVAEHIFVRSPDE